MRLDKKINFSIMRRSQILLFLLLLNAVSYAQEAQWRGPDRSGIFPEKGLLQKWPESGPQMIMKTADVGNGYSQPVLHDGVIYITGKKDENDILSAVNMRGEILYQVVYGKSWNNTYPETRSAPTIDGNRVYVISGMGELVCLEKETGNIIWKVNAHEEYQGEIHRWGVAESPLIVNGIVTYTSGGNLTSVVAFDKMTGKNVWKTPSIGGARTYVSPVMYNYKDVRLIIASTSDYVIGINPKDGKVWWSYKYLPADGDGRGATNSTNSAIIRNNEIFISKGYDQYGVMLQVAADGKSVKEKWRTEVLDTHHGHYVNVGDYIYGSNWQNNSKGNWVCLQWDNGKVMYETEWITKGPIAYADGRLYCYEERSGNVALVNPTPEKFDIVSTFQIKEGTGPHWAHPYIKDGKLIMRHGDVLMVFDIKSS
jgi:outer membrane protein assembly factor BamB